MTQLLLINLLPNVSGTSATPSGAAATSSGGALADGGGDLFRLALAGQAGAASTQQAAPTAAAASASPTTALAAKIKKLLDAGATQSEVIAKLAGSLANSVGTKLGITSADARSKLETIFASALAPPGHGADAGSASTAATAGALAERFATIQAAAQAIAGHQSGQQNRIAGNVLDALGAKDIPAPNSLVDLDTQLAGAAVKAGYAQAKAGATQAKAGVAAKPSAAAPPPDSTDAKPSASGVKAGSTDVKAGSTDVKTGSADLAPSGSNRTFGVASSELPAGAAATSDSPLAAGFAPASLLAGPASAAHPAGPASAASVAGSAPQAAAGDGRSVDFGLQPALATGGDTLLGRILTRAAVAAAARDTRAAAVPARSASGASSQAAPSDETKPADDTTTIAAFVKAFAAATGSAPPADDSAGAPNAAPATAAVAQHQAGAPVPAFVPAVAPFTIEHAGAGQAPAAPPAPAAAVDPSDIADQVLRGAFMRNVGQTSEMRLTLVPESLGDVSVKLVVGAGGSVSAHVVADTSEVRDALVAAQPQLSKSLADAGLKLSSFTVDVSNHGFGESAQQQNRRQSNARGQRTVAAVGGAEPVDDALLDASPTFGPPIAGPSSDYNYLA
jgi:flagellar hook-length control protein FliK